MYQPDRLLEFKPEPWPEPDRCGRILLEAANAIRTYGWVQNAFGDTERGFCAAGAIEFAVLSRGRTDFADRRNSAAVRLSRTIPHFFRVPNWNDEPGRTKEQVIAALEDAAFYDNSNHRTETIKTGLSGKSMQWVSFDEISILPNLAEMQKSFVTTAPWEKPTSYVPLKFAAPSKLKSTKVDWSKIPESVW